MIDTGAAVSLFDADLAHALGLIASRSPASQLSFVGVGGTLMRASCWEVQVWVLPWQLGLRLDLTVGFVPQLEMSTGNLLGRDFLEFVHFGLDQKQRTLYLGEATGRRT